MKAGGEWALNCGPKSRRASERHQSSNENPNGTRLTIFLKWYVSTKNIGKLAAALCAFNRVLMKKGYDDDDDEM